MYRAPAWREWRQHENCVEAATSVQAMPFLRGARAAESSAVSETEERWQAHQRVLERGQRRRSHMTHSSCFGCGEEDRVYTACGRCKQYFCKKCSSWCVVCKAVLLRWMQRGGPVCREEVTKLVLRVLLSTCVQCIARFSSNLDQLWTCTIFVKP